ncbi:hypothetical protein [Paenibacillus polymyxa]|uniref:hypothetical protein n=1 Tax=Paenibacillus polymyxa TaxID=1406 RepID=UPI0039BC701C
MSFVSIIVCNDYLSVVADSRAVNTISGEIDNEYEQKIFEIGEYVFIVNTGYISDAAQFLLNSKLDQSVVLNGLLKDEKEIRNWFNTIKDYTNTDSFFEVKFGGLSVENKFQVYTISSKEDDIIKINYTNSEIGYSFASSPHTPNDLPLKLFAQQYQNLKEDNLESVRKLQESINDYIADNDPTVNKNKSYYSLVK